jgi:hypothetical protein
VLVERERERMVSDLCTMCVCFSDTLDCCGERDFDATLLLTT